MNFKQLNKTIETRIFEGEEYNYNEEQQKIYKDRVAYFLDFFDTARMNSNEVYNFLFNNEDRENIRYRKELIKIIRKYDDLTEIFSDKEDADLLYDYEIFKNDFEVNTDFRLLFRNMCKAVLWLSFNNSYANNQITVYDDDQTIINKYKNNNGHNYFRGQSDFSWQLSPSLLRGFDYKVSDGCIIDNNKLYDIYKKTNLVQKYNDNIADKPILNGSTIDYEFLSFMQHAVSYSPLIDFTSNIEVAYKFALNKNNPNTYLQKDSSVFVLEIEGKNPYQFDISKFKVIYLNKKIKPGSTMNVVDSFGNKQALNFSSITRIKDLLRPKYIIYEKKTNDRMKYQKGKFILFYDYVSVKGNVYYMLNKQIVLFKKKILTSKKDGILLGIEKNSPQLNNSYLMNPYQVFND